MKKYAAILIFILASLSGGCSSRTDITRNSTFTPSAELPMLPELSVTQTSTMEVLGGAATVPPGDGYLLEFTHQVSSGLATIHAAAHTCSGLKGSWEGEFDVVMAAGKMTLQGAGTFNFTLPTGKYSVTGSAPFSGAGTVSGSNCVILDVSDPLQFEVTINPESMRAEIIMGSVGDGAITSQCGDSPPVTVPFAISWGPEPLKVPILPYTNCP